MRTSLTQTHTQKTKTKKTHRASSQNSSLNRKYLHYSRGKACYRLAIQNSIDTLFSALFLVVLIHSTGWKAKATAQTRKKVLKEKQAFLSAMVCPDKNWRKQWILNTVLYLLPLTSSLRRMVLFSTSVFVDIIHCWIILKNSLGTTLKKKKRIHRKWHLTHHTQGSPVPKTPLFPAQGKQHLAHRMLGTWHKQFY